MGSNLASIFNHPYARQLNNIANPITALGMYLVLKSRLIADWSVENMNHYMTLNKNMGSKLFFLK